jgi:hypothetical protein
MRSVLIRTNQVLQSSERSLLLEGGPSSQWCSHLARSEARSGKRSCSASATLGSPLLWQNLHLLYTHYSNGHASLSLSCLLLLLASVVRMVKKIVDLCCNPQPMQKHREFSRYAHRRSFLCVLASAGGYPFSMTP